MPAVAVTSGIGLATVGALLVGELVVPLPLNDQPLVPSSLPARTCTWYAVFSVSSVIAVLVGSAETVTGSDQAVAVCSFHRSSYPVIGGPVVAGGDQLTSRLVVEPEVALTVGASGAEGFSSTSVTLIVTVAVAESVPSDAVTSTSKLFLGPSKFRRVRTPTVIWPLDESMSKLDASAPPSVYVSGSMLASVAVTAAPTLLPAGVFSATERVTVPLAKDGTLLTTMSKMSLTDSVPSSAVTFTDSVPPSASAGVPANIREEAVNVSHDGSAAPFDRVAA